MFFLDGVHCRMQLGPRWRVAPCPAFQQDMYRWGGKPVEARLSEESHAEVEHVA